MQNFRMWIGGKWVEAKSGKTFPVVNPANGEEFARVALAGDDEVDRAVEAARKAFPIWSRNTASDRAKILSLIADAIAENAEEIVRIETLDHGWPIKQARSLILRSIDILGYAGAMSKAIMGIQVPATRNTLSYIAREPVGVCAAVIPWNVPFTGAVQMMAKNLAVGNTCVIKPASLDCLSALKLAELLEKIDLPPGAVNIITGPGGLTGKALVSHPEVDLISFVGSTEAGKDILSHAAKTVKNTIMELGGKNPFIVLEDADVDAATEALAFCQNTNSGQICASPGRVYVHAKIYDEFVDKLVSETRKIKVGDPFDDSTQMGPVVGEDHRDKIEGYIRIGIEEGATVVLGGNRPKAPLDRGYYVMPTVFRDVSHTMRIAREEIFGPVACIIKFDDEQKVVDLANDTRYGLCASVWTKDLAKGIRLAGEINTGAVWVNEHMMNLKELPWGGNKESGIGRDGSCVVGLEHYTQLKVVYADISGLSKKPWHTL
ncbi:MAG TPA: aldehyde dehydrogenase family protein [Syntrophorhabdaceae bacterium]|nr:aldehyde dehydrogenase family protein [Syntrophorhabdaceae bacterium]